MVDITKIKTLCSRKGYTSRKFQYQILSELTDVPPETCKLICSLQRTIRFAIPADPIGLKKSQEWQRPQWMIEMDNSINHLFKNI